MTISVTQLNNYIHGMVDIDGILSNVSVCGEVTNLKKAQNGGWYFSLKDEAAAINCFCYDNVAVPQSGAVVVIDGQVNYFVRNGSISVFVRRLTATQNTGAAYLKFVELKEKLKKEGLFDEDRKKIVPRCCKKIGIVTSATGAVIHDIETVSLRRQPFANLILYPVKVQGVGAEEEIAQGIEYFSSTDVDVVIVGRGGGSDEDLSVFNTETVVRAVSNCSKPVVSAVGHGIDYTLCDFAADKRAVTPSEAAEFVTIDVAVVSAQIRNALSRIDTLINSKIRLSCEKVAFLLKNIGVGTNFTLETTRNRISRLLSDGERSVSDLAQMYEQRLKENIAKANSLNPLNVLQRGYAYISVDGEPVNSVDNVEASSKMTLTLRDGKIYAQVVAKEKI